MPHHYASISRAVQKKHRCGRNLMLFKTHVDRSNDEKGSPTRVLQRTGERSMRDTLTKTSLFALMGLAASLTSTSTALALDEVTYGTNWLAQAEHGGFYQAVADGTYEKYGLKVTVVQGGPQAANRALLIAGKVDFYMGSPLGEMDAVKEGIPLIDVAAIFQKDPQVLLAHPDQGIEKFADLAKLDSIFMGKDGYVTYYEWMKKNFE
eukprot:gene2793-3283_t